MTRTRLLAAATALAMPVLSALPANAEEVGVIRNADSPTAITGSYLVMMAGRDSTANTLAGRYGGAVQAAFQSIPAFSVRMSEADAKRLAADPSVAFVEQDQYVREAEQQLGPASWGLDRIDERARPLDDIYGYDETGAGVNVYVLDSGVRVSHEDFGGRAHHGRDFVEEDDVAQDCTGHGTHVAGTIAGTESGVAKGAKIIAVRVLGCTGSTYTDVLQGIDWVTANHVKPAVANMSLGGGGSTTVDAAVVASINAGVTYVAAAGNSNSSACGVTPARVPQVLTVGATTNVDSRVDSSNHGSCLDLFAPGKDIVSAGAFNNASYVLKSGTSMASPHVAGLAALYLAKLPGSRPDQVAAGLLRRATSGPLTGIGSGSPNLLAYRITGPALNPLACSSAFSQITCGTTIGGAESPTLTWKRNGTVVPAWTNLTSVSESCTPGTTVNFTATVTASSGTDSADAGLVCRSGGHS